MIGESDIKEMVVTEFIDNDQLGCDKQATKALTQTQMINCRVLLCGNQRKICFLSISRKQKVRCNIAVLELPIM